MVIMLPGCTATVDEKTGEKLYGVEPGVDEAIEKGGKILETLGPPVVTGITALNAVAGAVASGLLTASLTLLGLYRKWRKPLMEQGVILGKVTAGLRVAGDVIETLVKPNAELWSKAETKLLKAAAKGAINADKV